MLAVIHEVGGHHNLLAHHVGKRQHGTVGVAACGARWGRRWEEGKKKVLSTIINGSSRGSTHLGQRRQRRIAAPAPRPTHAWKMASMVRVYAASWRDSSAAIRPHILAAVQGLNR